jgi:hypothetical protein
MCILRPTELAKPELTSFGVAPHPRWSWRTESHCFGRPGFFLFFFFIFFFFVLFARGAAGKGEAVLGGA